MPVLYLSPFFLSHRTSWRVGGVFATASKIIEVPLPPSLDAWIVTIVGSTRNGFCDVIKALLVEDAGELFQRTGNQGRFSRHGNQIAERRKDNGWSPLLLGRDVLGHSQLGVDAHVLDILRVLLEALPSEGLFYCLPQGSHFLISDSIIEPIRAIPFSCLIVSQQQIVLGGIFQSRDAFNRGFARLTRARAARALP